MSTRRKKGDVEWVRIGDLAKDAAFASIADVEVGLRHEGPGLAREWLLDLQQVKLEELKRVVKAREGLTPEIAPEFFDGKKRMIKAPKKGAPEIDLEQVIADVEEPPEAETVDTRATRYAVTIVRLVALVRAMREPEEIEEIIIPPFRDDDGNVRILTKEGMKAMSKYAERCVASCAAGIRGGSDIDGETDGTKIAAELSRLGVVEHISAKAGEVQGLKQPERFSSADSGHV